MQAEPANAESAHRELRRCTSSCHECRRRKIRCDYDPCSNTGSCTPCRKRRRECVPQHKETFAYETSATSQYRKVRQRLVRLEGLVDQLLKQVQHPPAAAASVSTGAETEPNPTTLRRGGRGGGSGGRPDHVAETELDIPRDSPGSSARAAVCQRSTTTSSSSSRNEGRLNTTTATTTQLAALTPAQQTSVDVRTIATNTDLTSESSVVAGLDALAHFLRTLFPPQEDVAIIVARGDPPGSPLRTYRQANGFLMDDAAVVVTKATFTPTPTTAAANTNSNGDSIRERDKHDMILSPSATGTGQALVLARKLVELAICLQQLAHDNGNGPSHAAAAAHFVDAVSRHVISRADDGLLNCVDGIELLMLQGVYHVNEGDWHRGWQTFRRAIGIASALGLDRTSRIEAGHGSNSNTTTATASSGSSGSRVRSSDRPELEHVWFRLAYSDRYMSLILGLPHAVTDDSSLVADMDGSDLTRLEHVHAVVAGRISARNELLRLAGFWDGGVSDNQLADQAYRETMSIDGDMKQATYLVSPEIWGFPAPVADPMQQLSLSSSFSSSSSSSATSAEIKQITARLFSQLKHFHLLVLLHFPYFIRALDCRHKPSPESSAAESSSSWAAGGSTSTHFYSIMAAVHAGREVLLRFLAYRALKQVPLFYRGFDLMALTAAVVLLLAHLGDGDDVLVHQRLGHLQLVSQTASCFEAADARGTNPASRSAARLLRALAAAEDEAAAGRHRRMMKMMTMAGGVVGGLQPEYYYQLWREDGPVGGDMTCGVVEVPTGLRLTVPHFGVIHVVRGEGGGGQEEEEEEEEEVVPAPQFTMSDKTAAYLDCWGQQWQEQDGEQQEIQDLLLYPQYSLITWNT
ncbi:hypothetical protein VTH82DRAFT_1476 [Thermothelomyces myriococcoides]